MSISNCNATGTPNKHKVVKREPKRARRGSVNPLKGMYDSIKVISPEKERFKMGVADAYSKIIS